jgi:hypothetical protein
MHYAVRPPVDRATVVASSQPLTPAPYKLNRDYQSDTWMIG